MAQGVVDVHSHIITPHFVNALQHHDATLDEGFPLPQWDVDQHLRFMDEAGIQTSVLTLAAPQPYFGDSDECAAIIRQVNEQCAAIKLQHPDRFMFCAALPLPDVDKAINEAIYALDVLGADGIKLATNSYGQYLGDPVLDTLMQVLNDRRAVVILHPHRPEPVNRQVMQQTPLAMQEYLSETTRAVANMISRNVLARYPNIKVVVPHCGAYLPLMVPRMKSLAPVMQASGLVGDIDWEKNLASLYYDLAGAHSSEVVRMMLSITSPDHLLYGSDYPYVGPKVLLQSLGRMRQYLADEPDLAPFKDMILYKNAQWLFGKLPEQPQAQSRENMLVRIAEIEVNPEYLNEYLEFANEVDRVSVEQEPGVVCLFPMQSEENPNQIRILEIYASQSAYQQHLKTAHFLKYKQGTLHMVKSLKLATMQALDSETMQHIFKKIKR